VDEERTDACGIARWIEQRIFGRAFAVASVKGLAFAPTPAADDGVVLFDDEIGAIANKLAIDREDGSQRVFDLTGGIVRRLQSPRLDEDQFSQRRHVLLAG